MRQCSNENTKQRCLPGRSRTTEYWSDEPTLQPTEHNCRVVEWVVLLMGWGMSNQLGGCTCRSDSFLLSLCSLHKEYPPHPTTVIKTNQQCAILYLPLPFGSMTCLAVRHIWCKHWLIDNIYVFYKFVKALKQCAANISLLCYHGLNA